MKKSLIALAVAGACSAAMAQSSVQLYGVADLWFGQITVKENGVKVYPASQTGLFDGGFSNSRFGFKGSEDLGGGLKANFQLEQGFNLDDGKQAQAGKMFSRQAWVGLSGGFGEVQLGKAYSAFDDVSGLAASVFDSDLAPINNIFASTFFSDSFNNTVKYITPAIGGFSGAVSYSFGEDKTATTKASKLWSLSGKYEEGPLAVGLGYAKNDTAGGDTTATRLAGSYDLGAVKLLASYGQLKDKAPGTTSKTNEWELGVNVPLASNLALSAGYGRTTLKEDGIKVGKANSFGAALAYSLSKRTTVYAGVNATKAEDVPVTDKVKTNIYAVGLKHTF
ncbi:Outer membrane porin protein 32 [Tepidimonas alkaliphilus]|uniref:Outer membrane porin protein 32 n=1 Tax=Tepidimonas alkaliphilus TaxID=2588942 RepID=A0A554W7E1_9BURK|nr:porin [Tepidimonas alkaliphilus]TSE19485.1 Outer membrane porin protein 32 [Tepidimonas alkaliphilus]